MMKRSDGALIGERGVQYGLQRPGGKPAPKVPARPLANVFGDDSDEDVETQVARQAEKKRSAAKVQQTYEEALAQDPTAFDYDGVYDAMKESQLKPKQQDVVKRETRYILQLKEQAELRKREEEIRFERRQLKDRQQEDHLYEGKEKFVTAAYKKKLEEDRKWVEQEKLREAEEAARDVRKVGHMGNFYANLLTGNVAMGTAKPGGARQPAAGPGPGSAAAAAAGAAAEAGGAAGGAAEGAAGQAGAEGAAQRAAAQAQAQQPELDKYERARKEAEAALRRARAQEAERAHASGSQAEDEASAGAGQVRGAVPGPGVQPPTTGQAAAAAGGAAAPEHGAPPGAGAAAAPGAAQGGAAAAAAVVGGKRRNDDEAVTSARERYLARKRAMAG